MSNREIRVSGSKEFETLYRNLSSEDELKRRIDEAMDSLKEEPDIGNKIEKRLWPKEYVKKYGINNLYRYSLGSNWRMIYTIVSYGKVITCVILEVMPHKDYDKKFGYKTS